MTSSRSIPRPAPPTDPASSAPTPGQLPPLPTPTAISSPSPEAPSARELRDGAGSVPAAPPIHHLSITDFLTDGSFIRLCDEISSLLQIPIHVIDAHGAWITRSSSQPWIIKPASAAPTTPPGALRVPLAVEGHTLGAIVIAPGTPSLAPHARTMLEQVLALLAKTASELCQHELDLRHRIKEVSALYKLSSLLARATSLDRVLNVALELCLDVLELDAGTIALFPEDDPIDALVRGQTEEGVVHTASKGLSRRWLDDPRPLSKDRLFDRMAINGEIVVSENLAHDDRVLAPERLAVEELCATIQAGMVVQNRPLGVIRLYARECRNFDEGERRLLRSIAQQSAVAVQQARLLKVQEEEQRIQRQLQLAADVQRRMLPKHVPATRPNIDVAAKYVPSFELGGDFYDFIPLGEHLGIVVGDVVGKGIAAALLMAAVRSSLRAYAHNVYDMDEVISRVNVALCRDTLDNEFATLWYGVLDPQSLRLTYCSAGHEPPFVVRVPAHRPPTTADIDELAIGGMVVGIDKSQRYQRTVYDMQAGDVFIAYTDGVTDTANFSAQKFGKRRLRAAVLEILAQNPAATAGQITEHIHWHLRQFAGLAARTDDETIVVVRVAAALQLGPMP